jgi:hypothetical protein
MFMKATEILNQIKEVLGLELAEEVKLEIQKLENGTSLEAASFEPSQEIFIVGEDGSKIALPVGEDYKLEDGRTITVIEEGIIDSIKEAGEAEEEEVVEEEEEVEAEKEDAPVKSTETTQKVVYATKEEVSEIKEMIKELMLSLKEEKVEDLELTAQVVEPIAHNPEAKSEANNNIGHNVSSNLSALREMIYNN